MITSQEAETIILRNTISLGTEVCSLSEAIGRILQENIYADRDLPPFNRAIRDGIAISFEAWQSGQKRFKVQSTQFAGTPEVQLKSSDIAIEIMTGAVCPKGTELVVMYEDLKFEEENEVKWVNILQDDIEKWQYIHKKGADRKQSDILIEKGRKIASGEIGVLASVGKGKVEVSKLPKIAIISTGNELVEVSHMPLLHQIRRSNVFALESALKGLNIQSTLFHLEDNKTLIEKSLREVLENFDIILLSGGVSKGKADYIPEVLENLGVQKLFHKVKQRPGKPFWFGKRNNRVVFALPGNPVSTMLCFYRYVLPYLREVLGQDTKFSESVLLKEDFRFEKDLTFFAPAKVYYEEARLSAKIYKGQGSGDFANLLRVDGFVELPSHKSNFKKGEIYPLWRFRY